MFMHLLFRCMHVAVLEHILSFRIKYPAVAAHTFDLYRMTWVIDRHLKEN